MRYGSHAEIAGPTSLTGRPVRCLDIRAGAGAVLAGLIASGETVVSALHHLDRGYEGFVDKLQGLGADVEESVAGGGDCGLRMRPGNALPSHPDGPHPNPSPIAMGEGLFGAGDDMFGRWDGHG